MFCSFIISLISTKVVFFIEKTFFKIKNLHLDIKKGENTWLN